MCIHLNANKTLTKMNLDTFVYFLQNIIDHKNMHLHKR